MDPCGKEYPFIDFSDKEKRDLELYCLSMFQLEDEIEIQYHIYPNDCNCCS
jgi:hypothetical protein